MMRPLEIALSAANLLAFSSLAISLPHTLRWMRFATPIAVLVVVAQIVAEGPRWQMIPAYVLSLLCLLIWLPGLLIPDPIQSPRLITAVGTILGVIGLLASVSLPVIFPIFHFPKPTGPYAIGTATYHWVDASRPELFTTDPDDRREIMAQVWYPAKDIPSAPRAPYLEEADAVTPTMARLVGFPEYFLTHFRYVKTNAAALAPAAGDQPRFPVLLFLSGQNGHRAVNTFQIEELVSHGYIVVGLDQPGAVALVHFPDGREVSGLPRSELYPLVQQSVEPLPITPTLFGSPMPEGIVPYFGADIPFALDQLAALNQSDPNDVLTGRLDLEQIGIFGISLGGINAAEGCWLDTRLKACLIMDVFMSANVVRDGLHQPAMWITRDADTMRLERERFGGWTEQDIRQHVTTMRAVYETLPGDGYYLEIPGMFHVDLTDAPYWSPILLPQLGMTGLIEHQRIFDIVNAYSVAFFDRHLKDQPAPLLDAPSSEFPEVRFESRR